MTEIVSGAAQGAAAGAVFGPLGAIAGGVLGAIGGVFGRKKRKQQQLAAAARRKANQIRNFQQRRAFINNFLTAQGTTLATGALSGADLGSSGVQGELASQRTQATTGLLEANEMDRLDRLSGSLEAKASRNAGIASMIGTVGGAAATIGSEMPMKEQSDPLMIDMSTLPKRRV